MSNETNTTTEETGAARPEGRPAEKFEINVNGRHKTVNHSPLTFDEVVELAFPGSHDPNVVFSVTYSHAASAPPAGELGQGGTVEVRNGTRFNVTRTVQS
jgi:hypothetical protein